MLTQAEKERVEDIRESVGHLFEGRGSLEFLLSLVDRLVLGNRKLVIKSLRMITLDELDQELEAQHRRTLDKSAEWFTHRVTGMTQEQLDEYRNLPRPKGEEKP